LLADGHDVVGYDNFSKGQRSFLLTASQCERFTLVEGDTLDLPLLAHAMAGADMVFHLAANADVRFGTEHPRKDLEQNTIATHNVLEAMRLAGIARVAFSSTGSVYGEPAVFPTPETCPFPTQTSLYGASKLAGEGLLSAYVAGNGFSAWIFRFVSILGERYTHGHVFDFYKQLLEHPHYLKVLGDGTQRKSYLYVQDCLSAILQVMNKETAQSANHRCEIYNLGAEEYCTVKNSISWICQRLRANPTLEFTGGERGWVGDNPFIFLDTTKVRKTGWSSKLTIRQAVEQTVDWLRNNEWVFEKRN